LLDEMIFRDLGDVKRLNDFTFKQRYRLQCFKFMWEIVPKRYVCIKESSNNISI